MTVQNDTANWYRFIDMTPQAEALFRFVEQTIDTELVEELAFLANYDQTKKAIQEVVDTASPPLSSHTPHLGCPKGLGPLRAAISNRASEIKERLTEDGSPYQPIHDA